MRAIKTDRLIIRPLQPSDHDDLQTIILDAEVVKYMRYHDITTPAAFNNVFENHFLMEQQYTFGIESKETHKLIGFYEFHPENTTGILTYALNRNAWGHGYVAEAGQAMMNYGFEKLNFDKIEAHYADLNPRSGRVMAKMGMKNLGEQETFTFPTGEVVHVMAYELTKNEWSLTTDHHEQAV
ncbi:GNAT family N-acetyltransferase [Companilactobacillus kimchiensis]|uniref:Putative acetyltransferase (Putative) n=1 Tax=Companilactobacillus kimchiensis TaxID=993692 RepID=A0A0R2LDA8_9LACO|nr:GNAT family N-acetyltransferase [Companilactobacillus kimchiensis]KRN99902.1 putative acetyltransferase (putative) [Companilactobacillus kimchiensis]